MAKEKDIETKKVDDPPLSAKEEWSEFAKTAVIAVILALFIRSFFLEPFSIPSGSMKPTLLIGDYLFVSKPAYGYSRYSFPFGIAPIEERVWGKEPARGDVAVFKLPSNPSIDYIKRVIGLPGDTIQVRGGQLYINGNAVPRKPVGPVTDREGNQVSNMMEYKETLPNGVVHSIYEEGDNYPLDNTPEFTVPEGHYFMMGDNRDNSQDSRVMDFVGFVPYENLVGRADFIFFSFDTSKAGDIPSWPSAIRYKRLLDDIDPVLEE